MISLESAVMLVALAAGVLLFGWLLAGLRGPDSDPGGRHGP